MKSIRQVKTVFIIFIAFVCCWSPYIVVLLYDNSDMLPLPVHLYASMLAHLHASLNFAIYGLMNRNLRTGFTAHLLACCCRRITSPSTAAAASATATATAVQVSCSVEQRKRWRAGYNRAVDVNRSFVDVEYHPLYETGGYSNRRNMRRNVQPTVSICVTEEHECRSTII